MAQQTAVDWFFRWMNDNPEATHKECADAYEQAKQIEKVMNEYSWIAGAEYSISVLKDKTLKESKESFEQYYNETYNKE